MLKQCAQGACTRQKFDSKVIEEGWLAANDITQTYYEENKDKLQQRASLLKDFDDEEFIQTGTVKELLHDFGLRYKQG